MRCKGAALDEEALDPRAVLWFGQGQGLSLLTPRLDSVAMMHRSAHLTKSAGIGIIITTVAAGVLIFLIMFAQHFYLPLVVGSIIAFQLSFIWTCAELIDGVKEQPTQDEPMGKDFTP